MQITEKLRAIARSLLENGQVDAVVGFRQGSLAHLTEPFMAVTPDQTDQLVFNSACRMNLAVYLSPKLFQPGRFTPDRPGKEVRVAVTAKGCDSRNMVTQIQENRYQRDQVHIIGLPCTGMADKVKLLAAAPDGIDTVTEQGDKLILSRNGQDTVVSKSEVLQSNCRTCISRNPVIWDEMAEEPVPQPDPGEERFSDVARIEAMTPADKADYFNTLVSGCTRCYACRNACPLCYCPVCFVDESRPQWVGKTVAPGDVMAYHLVRAFHDAGRCTDCGACEAACPMDIPIRAFTRKTIKDAKEAFGWETGMDPELRPPLDCFDLGDPEDFIR